MLLKIKNAIVIIFCIALGLFSLGSVGVNIYNTCCKNSAKLGVAAAGLIFTEGSIPKSEESASSSASESEQVYYSLTSDTPGDEREHEGEQIFPIIESKYTAAGTSYDNFFVKNTTEINIEIGTLLNAKTDLYNEDTLSPQVLIVHTHTTEAYMDTDAGYYYESYSGRSNDDKKNVVAVGKEISDKLKAMGIGVIHITTHHDEPGYNGSYSRSRESIENALNEYPTIKVVLDIHRDALSSGDEGIIKPTFTVNGKKAAQIMIMSGCDIDGSLGFDFWEENLKLALKLQSKAETLYPGMTRPLYFGNFAYNMNTCPGSLLIEVGTHANTLDEAMHTGKLLGDVIAQVLKEST